MPVRSPDGLDRAAGMVAEAGSVVVLAHVQPDADALGSALALGLALSTCGTPVVVAFAEPAEIPESLRSLPGAADLVRPVPTLPRWCDLLVTVDVNAAARLGDLVGMLSRCDRSLVIDHHLSNTRFGTDHLVDPTAESTTVLIAALLDRLGLPIDEPIATNLYAGLATDSVGFRHASAAAHRLAARLIDAGAEPDQFMREIADEHPAGWLGLLSTVLARTVQVPLGPAGSLAWTWVTRRDSRGLRSEERDSIVDIVATTASVAAVFKEVGPHRWQVSLRSRPEIDVAAVAVELGGGGHRRAAVEKLMIANIARYHRKALPKDKHLDFMELNEKDRKITARLGGILRIADALDRGYENHVKDIQFKLSKRNLNLKLVSEQDCTIERKAIEQKKDLFESAFDCNLVAH